MVLKTMVLSIYLEGMLNLVFGCRSGGGRADDPSRDER